MARWFPGAGESALLMLPCCFFGQVLLLRVPVSAAHHAQMMQRGGDVLLILLALWFLWEYRELAQLVEEAATAWWFMAPPLMCLATSVLALTGADWFLVRRVVGVEAIVLGLAILAVSAPRLPGGRPRLTDFWFPALGLSDLVIGLYLAIVPAPPPPELARYPLDLMLGLTHLLVGVGTLFALARGPLDDKPLLRILVGLILLAGGLARLLFPRSAGLPRVLGRLALYTMMWFQWSESSDARREVEQTSES